MRTVLLWVITQQVVVISYRRFGKPIGSIFKGQESRFHLQWSIIQIFGFLTVEDGTDKLSQNVGNKLPLFSA